VEHEKPEIVFKHDLSVEAMSGQQVPWSRAMGDSSRQLRN
jgi:hypothetical protein